jgi:hypothetical protein
MVDFLRDKVTSDLIIVNEKFAIGESTFQHQEQIIKLMPGSLKQYPLNGVGILSFILDEVGADEIKKVVRREFEWDRLKINKLKVTGDLKLIVDAKY